MKIVLLLLSLSSLAAAAPGLIGEYFLLQEKLGDEFEIPVGQKPWLVRADGAINFPAANGEFHGSKLDDGFMVRWSGSIQIAKPGEYSFYTNSDDGSRLYINEKRVVDNWGDHPMTKKSGKVELTKGSHTLKVIFQHGSGPAGCIVGWAPPGGKESTLPAGVLSHDPNKIKAITWDQKAFAQAKPPARPKNTKPPGKAMPAKFGNVLGLAIRLGSGKQGENDSYRAKLIRLNKEGTACVVFDTDTMRIAGAWTNGGLNLRGLPFEGAHGRFSTFEGEGRNFFNDPAPGWADPKGSFDEPRKPEDGAFPPLGPIPKTHAHYRGLYTHGDRTVLSYTVGGDPVLEMPAFENGVITRTIQAELSGPAIMALANANCAEKITVIGTTAAPEVIEGRIALRLPAGKTHIKVVYGESAVAKDLEDLGKFTKGGPARFTETVTTQGVLAKPDPKASYVLDRLTVPYKNPYGIQMRIGGFDFFTSDPGKAAVCTWDGDVWIVSGINDKLDKLTWKRFAAGGHETLGLTIVDDVIYTVADDEITRYHDLNGDGEADFYENFNNDWELTSGFHAFCFDLQTDPEGNFYFAFGSPVRGGGRSFERMSRHHGSIIRVSSDGSKMERYATGLRAPNGIGVSPTGQLTAGDNEGTFVPRCPIHWIDQGEFLGVVDAAENWAAMKTTPTVRQRSGGRPKHLDPDEAPLPLAWLPKNVDNSNGGQAWVTSDRWGPFKGEMLHMSYGQSSLYVVLKEKKGEIMQGGVVKIPVRPTSSAMRGKFNKRDGQFYISGLKGWQSNAGREGGLDRVRYTGRPVAMPSSLKVRGGGIEIGFTQKLDRELAEDPDSFAIRAADLAWTHDYGTREFQVGSRKSGKRKSGWSSLKVTSAKLLPDGSSVFIKVENLQPVHMMEIKLDLETEDGAEIVTRINNTIHVAN